MYDVILSFITAFMLTYFAIPSIIQVAKAKRLFDEPGERSSHTTSIPSLGGIAIFAGVIFSIIFWMPFEEFSGLQAEDSRGLQYILCAFVIIFLIGAKDDIQPLSPGKKFLGQIAAATILVYKANVQLTSFYGVMGIYDLPVWFSIPLSIFTIILIINAFNLVDGINGLSGSVGALISSTFGIWFIIVDRIDLAITAFALTGALIAFLKYNFTPAKIFMGDTGSLLVGLIVSILAIKFIEINKTLVHPYSVKSVPAVTIGILIIPLFDTLRVFMMRALRGRSPFHPDKNHIHHLLLDMNLSHMQATGVLVFVNIVFIMLTFSLQDLGTHTLLFIVLGLATLMTGILYWVVRKRRIKGKLSTST